MKTSRSWIEEAAIEEPLLNLTPLIDVVFVVLITFILVAPLLQVDHVELAPAGEQERKLPSSEELTIHVKGDNSIWFQGQCVTLETLQKKLLQEKGKTPQLLQDQRASFGTYQKVKNVLESCGFTEVDIWLEPS